MNIINIDPGYKDISIEEMETMNEINFAKGYLTSTDWYATRLAETGKAIPDEILTARQAARDRISELKA